MAKGSGRFQSHPYYTVVPKHLTCSLATLISTSAMRTNYLQRYKPRQRIINIAFQRIPSFTGLVTSRESRDRQRDRSMSRGTFVRIYWSANLSCFHSVFSLFLSCRLSFSANSILITRHNAPFFIFLSRPSPSFRAETPRMTIIFNKQKIIIFAESVGVLDSRKNCTIYSQSARKKEIFYKPHR